MAISPIGRVSQSDTYQQVINMLNQRAQNAKAVYVPNMKALPLEMSAPVEETEESANGGGMGWTPEEFAAYGTAFAMSHADDLIDRLYEQRGNLLLYDKYSTLSQEAANDKDREYYAKFADAMLARIENGSEALQRFQNRTEIPMPFDNASNGSIHEWSGGLLQTALGNHLDNLDKDALSYLNGFDSMSLDEKLSALNNAIASAEAKYNNLMSSAQQHFSGYTGRISWSEPPIKNLSTLQSNPRDFDAYEQFVTRNAFITPLEELGVLKIQVDYSKAFNIVKLYENTEQ